MISGRLSRLLAQTTLSLVSIAIGLLGLSTNYSRSVLIPVSIVVIPIALVANYLIVYQPAASALEVEREVANTLLSNIADNYALQFAEPDTPIRANLMKKDIRRSLNRTNGYTSTRGVTPQAHSGNYDSEELNLLWKYGQGCAGLAYEQDEIEWATRKPGATEWMNYERMNPDQLKHTENINSVLCIPIYGPDHQNDDPYPTSVLCLDSPSTVSQTHFDDKEVRQAVFDQYADDVAIL